MKKTLTITLLIILIMNSIHAQEKKNNHFLNSFVFGSSLTYLWDTNKSIGTSVFDEYFWSNYSWNLNFAVSLSKSFSTGIQVLNIWSTGTRIENTHNIIYGAFVQYDFLHKTPSKKRMFIEISIDKGDFFTGGTLDPYTRKGLWYNGIGFGFEIPLKSISPNLYLDLSGYNYVILNKIFDKYNYTQYIIGLNYRFGKNFKE
jgi:hypothetical protein